MAEATKLIRIKGNGQRKQCPEVGDDEQASGKRSCFFRSIEIQVDACFMDGCRLGRCAYREVFGI